MNLLKQVSQGANPALISNVNGLCTCSLATHTHTHDQVLVREPALIGLADSGQLTGKVIRLRLMVIVLVSFVLHTYLV